MFPGSNENHHHHLAQTLLSVATVAASAPMTTPYAPGSKTSLPPLSSCSQMNPVLPSLSSLFPEHISRPQLPSAFQPASLPYGFQAQVWGFTAPGFPSITGLPPLGLPHPSLFRPLAAPKVSEAKTCAEVTFPRIEDQLVQLKEKVELSKQREQQQQANQLPLHDETTTTEEEEEEEEEQGGLNEEEDSEDSQGGQKEQEPIQKQESIQSTMCKRKRRRASRRTCSTEIKAGDNWEDIGGEEDRRFVCRMEGCDKGFKRMEHLRRHQMIHKGEKPFPCQLCSAHFPRLDRLQSHMKRRHKSSLQVLPDRRFKGNREVDLVKILKEMAPSN